MSAKIEAVERFGNMAAIPLTFLGYVALAKSIWPSDVYLSGDRISWPAVIAILLILVGLMTLLAQYAQYRTARPKPASPVHAPELEAQPATEKPFVISSPQELHFHWVRISEMWNDTRERFRDLEDHVRDLREFWSKFNTPDSDPNPLKGFDEVITPQEINQIGREAMASAQALGDSLKTVISLVSFDVMVS